MCFDTYICDQEVTGIFKDIYEDYLYDKYVENGFDGIYIDDNAFEKLKMDRKEDISISKKHRILVNTKMYEHSGINLTSFMISEIKRRKIKDVTCV